MSELLAKFTVPLVMNRNKIKWKPFYLNLNNFISACRLTGLRNALKQRYTKMLESVICNLDPVEGKVKMLYVIHGKSKAKFDIGNVGAVVDKFVCDSLQEYGILEEDNYDHIPIVQFVWGGVDVENPTADVYILRHEPEYSDYQRKPVTD